MGLQASTLRLPGQDFASGLCLQSKPCNDFSGGSRKDEIIQLNLRSPVKMGSAPMHREAEPRLKEAVMAVQEVLSLFTLFLNLPNRR